MNYRLITIAFLALVVSPLLQAGTNHAIFVSGGYGPGKKELNGMVKGRMGTARLRFAQKVTDASVKSLVESKAKLKEELGKIMCGEGDSITVMMMGHGTKDGKFIFALAKKMPGERSDDFKKRRAVTAKELREFIASAIPDCKCKVRVVIFACHSGKFVSELFKDSHMESVWATSSEDQKTHSDAVVLRGKKLPPTPFVPCATLRNHGSQSWAVGSEATFMVEDDQGGVIHLESLSVPVYPPEIVAPFYFSEWQAPGPGDYRLIYQFSSPGDEFAGNDQLIQDVTVTDEEANPRLGLQSILLGGEPGQNPPFETGEGGLLFDAVGQGLKDQGDQASFVFKEADEDFGALCLVEPNALPQGGQVGLMVRSDLNPQSAFVALVVTPEQGLEVIARPQAGQPLQREQVPGVNGPVWLDLSRDGERIVLSIGPDPSEMNELAALEGTAMAGPVPVAYGLWPIRSGESGALPGLPSRRAGIR